MPRRTVPLPYYQRLGGRLRARREALRWTVDLLQDKTGIPKGHISNIEHGLCAARFDTIAKLAGVLKFPLDRLAAGIPLESRDYDGETERASEPKATIRKRSSTAEGNNAGS